MTAFAKFLENLQSRIILSDIIKSDIKLRNKGKTYLGLCPFHNEKSPSFNVDDDRGRYHCFGCGVDGNAINYIQERRGFTFMEAVEFLSGQVGLEIPKLSKIETKIDDSDRSYEILDKAASWMQDNLLKILGENARNYLKMRGISEEIQKEFRIGLTLESYTGLYDVFSKEYKLEELVTVGLVQLRERDKKPIDRFHHRLMFPIFDQKGRVVAFGGRVINSDAQPKYLNSPDTPLFSKSKLLYAHHLAKKNTNAKTGYFIVEGYLDVISLHQNGFGTAVAPLGTALTEDHCDLLWRHQVPPILCFDGDTAGYKAAVRSAIRALPLISTSKRLNFVFLPDGEDPDSLIQKDKNLFIQLVNEKKPLSYVLWQYFQKEQSVDSPEAQSLFKKAIKDFVELIGDAEIKESYMQYFKDQLNELCYAFKRQNYYKKNNFKINKSSVNPLTRPLKNKKELLLQKILLVSLTYHPYLIVQMVDKLMYVNFDSSLSDLCDFLISYDGPFDKVSLLQKLRDDATMTGLLELLSDKKVFEKAPFIQKSEKEEIIIGWQEIYDQLQCLLTLDREVKEAHQILKDEFTEKSWNRIKVLQTLKFERQTNDE